MKNNINFKETNISWIGEIPIEWNLIRAKYLFNRTKEINKDLRCKNLLSLTYEGVLNKDFYASEGLRPENYNTYQLFDKDDLVFKMIDLENVKTSRVGIVHEYGIMSSAYICFKPLKEKIYPKFSYWFFYDLYKKEIYNSIGSGVRSTLSSDDMSEFEIPVPQIKEQKIISRYLDKKITQINSLVEKIQKKIKLLKELRTSLINQCTTKGLDPNVEMKESGAEFIGIIPKKWDKICIKHLVSTKVTDGPHETPTFVEQGIPFLSVEGIVGNKINFNKIRGFITKETHEIYSKKCKPQKFDILLVKSGSTTGKSSIVETDLDFNIWSPLCILRSDTKKIDPYFFFNAVQSHYFRTQVEIGWSYGTQPNIGMGVIENLLIVVPPLDEQVSINSHLRKFLDDFDKKIENYLKRIEFYKEYRLSLISSCISGKIKVTEDML